MVARTGYRCLRGFSPTRERDTVYLIVAED